MHVPHARHPERRREAACARVRRGELSRARQVLTAAELAPGDEATRAALTDPAKRPPQPREPIPPEVLQFQPPTPVRLTSTAVARSLREAKRGSAPGLSGARAEHYKVLLGCWAMRMMWSCLQKQLICWHRLRSRTKSRQASL